MIAGAPRIAIVLLCVCSAPSCRGAAARMNEVERARHGVRLGALRTERERLAAEADRLRLELRELTRETRTLERRVKAAAIRRDREAAALADLLAELRRIEEDRTATAEKLAAAKKEQAELTRLEAAAAERRRALETLRTEIEALDGRLKERRAAVAARSAELRAEIARWDERLAALEGMRAETDRAWKALRAQLRQLLDGAAEKPAQPPEGKPQDQRRETGKGTENKNKK